ncbi:MAG: hypothetical protein LBH51_04010 [Treponema sp.]|jgi:hypothetical protein|nr:hypothetical protein [Treponema sp.]
MRRSLGVYIIHAAAALYLLADGILGLGEQGLWQRIRLAAGRATGNEIVDTLVRIFGTGDLSRTLIILFSVLAVAGGLFLLLELFGFRIRVVHVVILLFMAVWLAFIVLSDVIYAFRDTRNFAFLPWLRIFASHAAVLGALINASRKFGG